jgi:ATP-dependent RNA helicase DeaD
VFCRTRDEVDELTETMNGRGYRAEALHGGMDQEQRDR